MAPSFDRTSSGNLLIRGVPPTEGRIRPPMPRVAPEKKPPAK